MYPVYALFIIIHYENALDTWPVCPQGVLLSIDRTSLPPATRRDEFLGPGRIGPSKGWDRQLSIVEPQVEADTRVSTCGLLKKIEIDIDMGVQSR